LVRKLVARNRADRSDRGSRARVWGDKLAVATNLTAIRISAELDASNYIQNAERKVAADAKMVAGADKLSASLETTDRKLNTNTGLNRFLASNDAA
jgi:hypothetical protein